MSLYKSSSDVIEVGKDAFVNKKLKPRYIGSAGSIVIFYGAWCGHCKTMAPDVKKFARNMGSMMKVITVESKEEDLLKAFGIQAFPTIKYARSDGVLIQADNFGRDLQSMLDFACSNASVCKRLK